MTEKKKRRGLVTVVSEPAARNADRITVHDPGVIRANGMIACTQWNTRRVSLHLVHKIKGQSLHIERYKRNRYRRFNIGDTIVCVGEVCKEGHIPSAYANIGKREAT